jgi:tetratricopeptide (TPR) repeat protein
MIDINEPASRLAEHKINGEAPTSIPFVDVRRAIELALRLGDSRAAETVAEHLRKIFPEAIAPLIFLGQALLDLGAPSAAIAHFRTALSRNPLDAEAWIGLAGALSLNGQTDEAATALCSAALHDPLDSELLTPGIAVPSRDGIGIVYLRRGYANLAAAELKAMLDQHPDRHELRVYYVEALRRDGDHNAARTRLAELLSSTPANLPALLLQAALSSAPSDSLSIRQQCARYDIDGQMTRRFFAPERPPWNLAPEPVLPWSAVFEPLADHFAHAKNGHKVLAKSSAEWIARSHTPDSDARAFIATAEQVRHRIAEISGAPPPLAPWNAGNRQRQLLLGCKRTLLQRYGEPGFAAIDRRLQSLADALGRRGVVANCCYIDDAASLQIDDQIALAPADHDPTAIRNLVRTFAESLDQRRQELGTALLIGGDDSIPFHRLANPLHDDDPVILSDTPYGSDDAGYLLPHRVVARLPDGAGSDPSLLLAVLDQMIDYHSGSGAYQKRGFQLRLLGGRRKPARQRAIGAKAGYSAEIWQAAAREVLDALDANAPLTTSPPLDADTLDPSAWNDQRVLYVNLHGAAGLPNWYGQPDVAWPGAATRLPIALRPDQLGAQRMAGGLLISEACYGAEIIDRGPENCIPLRALAEGMLACVGATASSYGNLGAPMVGADLLCQRLLAQLAAGAAIGDALHRARLEFAQTMYRRQGYLDDLDIKTLAEFMLLGDPWAALESGAGAPANWPITKLAGIERVAKPRPKLVLEEAQVPRDLLKRARLALRQALPGAISAPLHIIAQPNMRSTRKSDSGQELMFSAQDQQLTIDGHQIAQTAHVTVSGQAVVKVAVTH